MSNIIRSIRVEGENEKDFDVLFQFEDSDEWFSENEFKNGSETKKMLESISNILFLNRIPIEYD